MHVPVYQTRPKNSRFICLDNIFELCQHFSGIRESELIEYRALMNVIFRGYREYVVTYNTEEQSGLHDSTRLLMNVLGIDVNMEGKSDNMVSICAETGFEYLRL